MTYDCLVPTHLQRRNTSENIKYNEHFTGIQSYLAISKRSRWSTQIQTATAWACRLYNSLPCDESLQWWRLESWELCIVAQLRTTQLWLHSGHRNMWEHRTAAQHSGVSITRDYSLTSSSFWESCEKLIFQLHLSLGLGTVRQISSSKEKQKR